MVGALCFLASASSGAQEAPLPSTAAGAPNLWGQTGLVRTSSARVRGNLVFGVSAAGFATAAQDSVVPDVIDFKAMAGGQLALSTAFLDVFEVALATRSAGTSNNARGPAQLVLGDLYPSLKAGLSLLPLAVGVEVRGLLPTRVDRVGVDFANAGVTATGLLSLDLHEGMGVPLRVHLNGGYTFQSGKYLHGEGGRYEDNPNFYDGVDGALLALAADAWFYDSVHAGLGLEAPLPVVTPFVEVFYRTALGVPETRGPGGQAYSALLHAQLVVTPGVRVALGEGFTLDMAADVGVLGTAGGATDLKNVTNGVPVTPAWLGRVALTGTFEPFASPKPPPVDPDPVPETPPAPVERPAEVVVPAVPPPPAPARLVGWLTNKDDELVDAELELWDATGVKAGGRTSGGAFDVEVRAGPAALVARADGYLAQGLSLVGEAGGRARASMVLKKAPRTRKAVLTQDRITYPARLPFEFKKARLQSTAEYVLEEVVDLLLRNPAIRVLIEVHAEALATPVDTQRLADERAQVVMDALAARGVWRDRLQGKGFALSPGDSERLRRVDLLVVP